MYLPSGWLIDWLIDGLVISLTGWLMAVMIYLCSSHYSVSEEDMDEMDTTEADGEVQIVTECWVEPQFGVCINNTPERLHFERLTSVELAKAVSTFF